MNGQSPAPRLLCALWAAILWLVPVLTLAQEPATEPAPVIPPTSSTPDSWCLFSGCQASYTWLPRGSDDGLGVTELDLSAIFSVALPGDLAPIKITPGFVARSFDGPASDLFPSRPDVPANVYDLSLDIGWRPRLAKWLFVDLGITPGIYSDFHNVNEDSFRLRGRALGIIALSEQLQLVGGLLYVNRNNTKILPAGGVLWSPTDATRLEILFPQPKLSQRLFTARDGEWWGYIGGEFGGGAWTVERAGGLEDSMDYRDIRLLLGVEAANSFGMKWRAEVGYVFKRAVDFTSITPDYHPGDTILLRAGLRY